MLYDSLNLRPFQYLCMQQFFSHANRMMKKSGEQHHPCGVSSRNLEKFGGLFEITTSTSELHNYDYTILIIKHVVISVFPLAFKIQKDSIMMWIGLWFAYTPNLNISFPLFSAVNTKCIGSETVNGNQTPLATVQLET